MKNIITPEEQTELEASLPALLKALGSGSPAAKAWLASWRSKKEIGVEAEDQAAAIRKEVGTSTPKEQVGSLHVWMGFPTDLTRCSPFFPMNPNELGYREYLEDFVITSASWGEIKYTGPKLSTYEEDVLMVLLAVLENQGKQRQITYTAENIVLDESQKVAIECGEEFVISTKVSACRKTYTYTGPASPLLRLLVGTNRNPSKKDYQKLLASLKRLTVAGVELAISDGKTKSGKRRGPRLTQMSAMLSGVLWDDKKKELTATINPFFYETYMAGRVTLIDVATRMQLKGVITKALYRFVQSQRSNPVFAGHFLTLADALNMDREQPAYKTRQLLRGAINELIRHGILTKKSRFVEQDIVRLERAEEALPPSKNKKLENR